MLAPSKQEKMIDMDERKNPLMTLKTVKFYCQRQGLFSTPQLNDKLYLQYKGFIKIIPETISQYTGLVALWLNNNGISKIEGLDNLINLTSLALNNNFISKIQGLQNLYNLSILNLSHNKIQIVQGLDSLRKLQTINLAHNFLISFKAIQNLKVCQFLSTVDLSQNQLQNSQEVFQQIIQNKNIACLYLKSTPLSRGFKNYRKRLISSLKKLKFLDDRPVLQQDHRLSQAWIQGGIQYQRKQKQKLAEQKHRKQQLEKQQKLQLSLQQKKSKPQSFIASIKDTSIRIMNIDDQEEEQRIIAKYFEDQRIQIEKNKQKQKEQQQKQQARKQYYQTHQTQVIASKVNEILGRTSDDIQDKNMKIQAQISKKWKDKYEKILETLLLRYKFDFSEVQPSFNMILADINKKLLRGPIRFQIDQLRKIWTKVQIRKRSQQIS